MKLRIISFAAGIACLEFSSTLPQFPQLIPMQYSLGSLLLLGAAWRLVLPSAKPWREIAVLMLLFLAGYGFALDRAEHTVEQLLPEALNQKPLDLSGQIIGLPQKRFSNGREQWRFDFLTSEGSALPNRKLRLSHYPHSVNSTAGSSSNYQAGERWRFAVKLRRPRGFSNPAGFDYAKWLVGQGYAASGYVVDEPAPVLLEALTLSTFKLSQWRSTATEVLNKNLSGNSQAAYIKALSVGDKSGISQADWQALNRTGTSHLMAISGLHIGVAASIGWAIGALFQRLIVLLASLFSIAKFRFMSTVTSRLIAPLCAANAAFFYAVLAGFALPTQRALAMALLGVLAVALRRPKPLENAWFIALLAVLLIDPMAVHGVGFYLSFGAVAALIWAMRTRAKSPWRWLWLPQWVVFIGLMPLLIWQVGQLSLVSLPANIVAIPIVSFLVVPSLLLAMVLALTQLSWLAGISAMIWQYVDLVLSVLFELLQRLADLPNAALNISAPPISIGLAVVAVAVMLLPRGLPGRWLALILLLPIFLYAPARPKDGEFWLDMFDVGQGSSILIRTKQHNLVYDLGPEFSEYFNTAEAVVLPNLYRFGVDTLDMLVLSHGDNDHAGAADKFLAQMTVEKILLGEPLTLTQPTTVCGAGHVWVWDSVRFEVLHPEVATLSLKDRTGNNASCVIKVSSPAGSVLLSGDIEKSAEAAIVKQYGKQLKSDVLMVPHHGSKTSSSLAFLQAVSPAIALVSAGYQHRYGHPATEIINRYENLGIQLLNTANGGHIQFYFENTAYKHQQWRNQRKNWWHALPRGVLSPKVPPL